MLTLVGVNTAAMAVASHLPNIAEHKAIEIMPGDSEYHNIIGRPNILKLKDPVTGQIKDTKISPDPKTFYNALFFIADTLNERDKVQNYLNKNQLIVTINPNGSGNTEANVLDRGGNIELMPKACQATWNGEIGKQPQTGNDTEIHELVHVVQQITGKNDIYNILINVAVTAPFLTAMEIETLKMNRRNFLKTGARAALNFLAAGVGVVLKNTPLISISTGQKYTPQASVASYPFEKQAYDAEEKLTRIFFEKFPYPDNKFLHFQPVSV